MTGQVQGAPRALCLLASAVRLYGTGTELFDQTWKPDDLVKVK
ncbi:hypothetical protein [Mesorhizobium sp. L-8-10]|nr:hypothetical protein [Mesorhizobium sp. L-8-10]